ncbi:MAG TPA: hypothetical protein VHA76_08780 [Solirubrobacterales bacterium]|nr:hypothetical protein [Solirubrobacterales bacterium]
MNRSQAGNSHCRKTTFFPVGGFLESGLVIGFFADAGSVIEDEPSLPPSSLLAFFASPPASAVSELAASVDPELDELPPPPQAAGASAAITSASGSNHRFNFINLLLVVFPNQQ